jgi:hypothetical protein
VTFASLKFIVYPTILDVNIPDPLDFFRGGSPAGVLHVKRYMSYELNFEMQCS